MFETMELLVHHGGSFNCNSKKMYVGGVLETVPSDPDVISYPHLKKFLEGHSNAAIKGIFFKKPNANMESLQELCDDHTALKLIELARSCGQCEIFVDHAQDELHTQTNVMEAETEIHDEHAEENLINDDTDVGSDAAGDETDVEGEHHSDGSEEDNADDEEDGLLNVEVLTNTTIPMTHNDPEMENIPSPEHGVENESEDDTAEYDSSNPPSLHSEGEDDAQSKRLGYGNGSYNPESDPPHFKVGMLFEDGKQFKNAMIRYAVYHKRDIVFVKNEPLRVRLKCASNCPFAFTGSWEAHYKCFQLKVWNSEHLCNLK
ncbi:unnamed protein product [Cuscuta epithymum]|uniref:Transposase MuDR plant domain-containing protein n=1 Tax=Cuscuta epithymum TaxID=186058 RepID=A0AAV0FQY1_9ASTE|nr:unnamed protein product [Cuscuta epithymum]